MRSHAQAVAISGLPGITVLRSPARREADPASVLARIANAAAAECRCGDIAAMITTGGDTMDAILDRSGVDEFRSLHEFEPGFPLGRISDDRRPLLIGMQAGGSGDDSALHRAIVQIRRLDPRSR